MAEFHVITQESVLYRINSKIYKFNEIPKIDIRLFAASQGLNISEDGKTLTCYKAVEKDGDVHRSWFDNDFVWKIGEYACSEKLDPSILNECSYGLHGCSIQNAFKFGFNSFPKCDSILELKVDISDPNNYVVPYRTIGSYFSDVVELGLPDKFRFKKCFVAREVKIENCLLDPATGHKYRL